MFKLLLHSLLHTLLHIKNLDIVYIYKTFTYIYKALCRTQYYKAVLRLAYWYDYVLESHLFAGKYV